MVLRLPLYEGFVTGQTDQMDSGSKCMLGSNMRIFMLWNTLSLFYDVRRASFTNGGGGGGKMGGNVCLARYLSIKYPDFSPRFTL